MWGQVLSPGLLQRRAWTQLWLQGAPAPLLLVLLLVLLVVVLASDMRVTMGQLQANQTRSSRTCQWIQLPVPAVGHWQPNQ